MVQASSSETGPHKLRQEVDGLKRELRIAEAELERRRFVGEEEFKELNATIRQWETLLFATAKDFLTYTSLAVGAAGTVISWSNVEWGTRRLIAQVFLGVGAYLCISGSLALKSQHAYLAPKYTRRGDFVTRWKGDSKWSGRTVPILQGLLVAAGVFCLGAIGLFPARPEPAFSHAKLTDGTDISRLKGLTRDDFVDTCKVGKVRLPSPDIELPDCK